MTAILQAVIVLVSGVPVAAFRGIVVSKLWAWYVVTTFPNVPRLGVVQSVGIMWTLYLLTFVYSPADGEAVDDKSFTENVVESTIVTLVVTACAFAAGWFWTLFL